MIGYAKWINGRFRGPDDVQLTGIFEDGAVRPVNESDCVGVPCVAAGGREAQGASWGVDLLQFAKGANVRYISTDAERDSVLATAINRCREVLGRSGQA